MIQHSDINVGPASYNHMRDDQLLVTSIFYTIQGEGPWAGCPSVFVRLAGCNRGRKEDMGCQFCDTRFYFAEGTAMSFADIGKEIRALGEQRSMVTVITGGEPMMQDNLSKFVEYHKLMLPGRSIQIESNGDRIAKFWPQSYAGIVISPKAGKGGYIRIRRDILKHAMCLKFVINDDPVSHYFDIPGWALEEMKPDRIYLSPMTVYLKAVERPTIASAWDGDLIDHAATRRNYKRAASLALAKGLRMSIQSHLFYELE